MPNTIFEEKAKLIQRFADEGKLLLQELEACVKSTAGVKEHFEFSSAGDHSLLVSLHGLYVLFHVKVKMSDNGVGQGFICGHIRSLGDQKVILVCDREFKFSGIDDEPLVLLNPSRGPCTRARFVEFILYDIARTVADKDLILGLQWSILPAL